MKTSGMSLALRCWVRRHTPQLSSLLACEDSRPFSLPTSSSLPALLEAARESPQLLVEELLQSLSSPLSWKTNKMG